MRRGAPAQRGDSSSIFSYYPYLIFTDWLYQLIFGFTHWNTHQS